MNNNWILYGAYGYTGKLIIKEALKKNYNPILGGRDKSKLIPLAERLGLGYEVFDLKDRKTIKNILTKYDLIFNAAGPFKYTSKPIVNACLQSKTHYLDITGELPVLERNLKLDNIAKKKGISIISGVGFDVVPSDCLINVVAEKIQNPVKLELAITGLGGSSPGTLKTMMEHLPKGIFSRSNGNLITEKLGKNVKKVRFLDKQRLTMQITWGDLATAYYSTQIPNINTFMAFPRSFISLFQKYGDLIQFLLSISLFKRVVQKMIGLLIKGPDRKVRYSKKSFLWAKVENKHGERAEAWLKTIEPYRFTGISAIKAIEKVFEQNLTGALTPAQAFGKDFILKFPETNIYDSL
ncbi:MAG: Trans-acting enoyl reductase [Promethearchaeota archaeon]|nr:MAG: Trans-acting enoyl reductase [Candidatus Lokiarchaeota archaeon]